MESFTHNNALYIPVFTKSLNKDLNKLDGGWLQRFRQAANKGFDMYNGIKPLTERCCEIKIPNSRKRALGPVVTDKKGNNFIIFDVLVNNHKVLHDVIERLKSSYSKEYCSNVEIKEIEHQKDNQNQQQNSYNI